MIDKTGLDEREIAPIEALEKAKVPFIRLAHPAAETMELCRGIGEEYGASHCKNLFLTNKRGDDFFLLLMDAEKPYRTSDVSKKLGSTRLSFASPEQLKTVLGLCPGSVSVMGLVNGCAKEAYDRGSLHIAIDKSLLSRERICVHPNVNTASLIICVKDIERLLAALGYGYCAVEI